MREADPERTGFRRSLRVGQTEADGRLRYRPRNRRRAGFTFVRRESIGRAVADVCCREARPIIEPDGGQHAAREHDRIRDAWLAAQGYRVLRFCNAEGADNVVDLMDTILAAPPPSPRLRGEGRDDPVVGAASPEGDGEGAAPLASQPEPPPHPRLPPRSGDIPSRACQTWDVAGALSPQAGRGEKHP